MPTLRREAGGTTAPTRVPRELASLADRLHRHHPDVPRSEIASMVDDEYAALARARVQSFRMILTERAVRRRLARACDRRGPLTRDEQP